MALITVPELLDTKTYAAQRVRHMLEHMVPQEGVWAANDYKVVQRAAGANLSVDVGAGAAWIKGDTGTRQGLYHLVNDGTVNLAIGAAHGSLPRVDQVIARIFDSTVSGGSDVPTLSILAGTATSGATLDNRNGAAALPGDAIRLADIHVPATDTTISDNQIRDRRPWARGAFERALGSGSGDYSTSSATPVLVSADLQRRIECSGVPLIVRLLATTTSNGASYEAVSLYMDGALYAESGKSQTHNVRPANTSFAFEGNGGFEWRIVPPAGSHLFDIRYARSGGTAIYMGNTNSNIPILTLQEDARQVANNGTS